MKKLYGILMLLSLVVVSACRKSDNATMPDGIVYINQPQIEKSADGDLAILDLDPLAFKASVVVDLYFNDTKKPDYLDIVVMKNEDAKNAKVIKAKVSTYPTTVELDGQLLTDIFGEAIKRGDKFDVGANYIEGGKTYVAFPEGGGSAYGAGVTSQPGASPTVTYMTICAFDADNFIGETGEFVVTTDPWGDFGVGTVVEVEKVSETEFSIEHVAVDDGFGPLRLIVNPADNTVKIESVLIASVDAVAAYYGGGGVYGSLTIYTGGAVTASYVDPCENEIVLNIQYVLSNYGNQGAFELKLKRVE
ncbi:MAG TPA: hypothetical protein PKA53_04580 [Sphingobacterium sp.]|nr:hypothetical protein [Sphingobacterium sp.]